MPSENVTHHARLISFYTGTILAIGAVRVITRGLHGFIVSRDSVEPPGRAARL